MKAKIENNNADNARNLSGDKELISAVTVVDCRKKRQPIRARFWMARSRSASVVYCSLWASNDSTAISGYGTAGGYGYHKPSAALSAAFDSAGISLNESIAGVGERAMKDAVKALAIALGSREKDLYIVWSE